MISRFEKIQGTLTGLCLVFRKDLIQLNSNTWYNVERRRVIKIFSFQLVE